MMNKFHQLSRRARLVVNGGICSTVFKARLSRKFDASQTITVFGSIRSGSTWLAELLSSICGHMQVFEPLHPDYVPQARVLFPERDPFITPSLQYPQAEVFFSRLLEGRVTNSWTLSQTTLRQALTSRRLVVKFVRGNLLLPWIIQNEQLTLPPVLVMRHPCATVASQLQKRWPPAKARLLSHEYLLQNPTILEKCNNLSTRAELATLGWCLRYHAPLKLLAPEKYLLVTYEQLVTDTKQQLEHVFDTLNIDRKYMLDKRLHMASDTSTPTSAISLGMNPLRGWKKTLDNSEITDVLRVTEIFGMNFYSEDLFPDLSLLQEFRSPNAAHITSCGHRDKANRS